MLRFENVGMRYGRGPEVLRDVNFELAQGSFHFLTGASGAGKSSLMRLMYSAIRPSRGLIYIFDQDIAILPRREMAALRRQIGVVFQEFRLINHMSVLENVALPLRIIGEAPDIIEAHAKELLTWVGLADHMRDSPSPVPLPGSFVV